jgi:DNA topoisomerase-3
MTTLIICEKNSVAQEIASFVPGKTEVKNGYIEKKSNDNTYLITYTRGHLLKIANNQDEKWSLSTLPIFPDKFIYEAVNDFAKNQIEIIGRLLEKSQTIVVATDAGREGELIAREVLNKKSCKIKSGAKIYRLWTSEALSKEVYDREIKRIKPIKEYDAQFFKALARQHCDWMVGVNLTRETTLNNSAGLISVGRVQTPLLSIIVDRCIENRGFKKEISYTLCYKALKGGVFPSSLESKDKGDINSQINRIKDHPFTIRAVRVGEDEETRCPHLHSLTSLQREANRMYGYTAIKTLEIAQVLYEKYKCLSYPRTDSQHLAESSRAMVKSIMIKLNKEEYIALVDGVGREMFDDSKLTDHHALIPLSTIPEGAGYEEKNIYHLVRERLYGFFRGSYRFKKIRVECSMDEIEFKKTFVRVIDEGWKQGKNKDENEEVIETDFREGEVLNGELVARQNETKPPKLYSDDTILSRMEKLSLGTPATRAEIIRTLEVRGYVYRKGKNIISTPKGESLVKVKSSSDIIKPEMTSRLEQHIERIKTEQDYVDCCAQVKQFIKTELSNSSRGVKGGLSEKQIAFVTKIKKERGANVDIREITRDNFEETINKITEETKIICICGEEVKEGEKAYYCPKCKVGVYKIIAGKKITRGQAIKLYKGESVLVKGFRSKAGRAYDAKLKVKKGKIEFEFT